MTGTPVVRALAAMAVPCLPAVFACCAAGAVLHADAALHGAVVSYQLQSLLLRATVALPAAADSSSATSWAEQWVQEAMAKQAAAESTGSPASVDGLYSRLANARTDDAAAAALADELEVPDERWCVDQDSFLGPSLLSAR